ncbi:MAG: slipin family protein [Myxococcota bacterium]
MGLAVAVGALIVFLPMMVRILREYERAVIFRLGRMQGVKGPGLIILLPFIDQMERVDLRTFTYDVPSQDIITRDNVSVKVNAVIYFRVVEPEAAVLRVENYSYATSQMAQTKLRDVLGQVELDDLLSERDKINEKLQEILDKQTDPWGIKVSTVELKHVDLPHEMVRAMARQAEAERERRAKIISAEGEFQASEKLGEAAEVLSKNAISIQLRYLQTLLEIANNGNSTTTIFPLPVELLSKLSN